MTAKDIWPHYFNDFIKQRCVDRSMATGGTWVVKANPYEGGVITPRSSPPAFRGC